MAMPHRGEVQGFAGFFLDALDVGPLDFAYGAAFDANQMIVVQEGKGLVETKSSPN